MIDMLFSFTNIRNFFDISPKKPRACYMTSYT